MSEGALKENAIPPNDRQTKEKQGKNKVAKDAKPLKETAPSDKLTEKQLRKLEWEKKLAEEKLKAKDSEEGISKAVMKAKRREQQEAQRLVKAEKSKPIVNNKEAPKQTVAKPIPITPATKKPSAPVSPNLKKPSEAKKLNTKQVQLVKHLYRIPDPEYSSKVVNFKDIHPVFVKLGVQYSEKVILGSNARTLALLAAIQCLVKDMQVPAKQEYCRYLENVLQNCTKYLQDCRPFAVSMTNALRAFKSQLRRIETTLSDNGKRELLTDFVDTYIRNDMKKAWDAICIKMNGKIVDGDVVLTYGCSSLIRKVLQEAHQNGKKFSVIVVDSRPLLEGREMLRRIVSDGIKCSYVLLSGLSSVMKRVTKVMLGAHALLTNGCIMSRIGSAQVALVAQAYNKSVLVCCETYKFSERVQTDSFVYNEIGDPNMLLTVDTSSSPSPLLSQKDNPKLNILNLLYDVTPPNLVNGVVTERGILHCSSVPVVCRINAGENPA